MNARILLTSFLVLPLFSAAPALAMNGLDAARSCNAQPKRCSAQFDEGGGVTIYVDGYVIDCNSPQEECTITIRPRVLGGAGKPATNAGEVLDPGASPGSGRPGGAVGPRPAGLPATR